MELMLQVTVQYQTSVNIRELKIISPALQNIEC